MTKYFKIKSESDFYEKNFKCFILRYFIFLYLEFVLEGVTKNRPMEKQVDAEIQEILKHAPARKLTKDKMMYFMT